MYTGGELVAFVPAQQQPNALGDLGNIFGTIWDGIKKGAGEIAHGIESGLPTQQQIDAATQQWLHQIGQATATNTSNTTAGNVIVGAKLQQYVLPALLVGGALFLATRGRRGRR